MQIFEWTNLVEKKYPLEWCQEWDNSGLIVGNLSQEVTGVAVALDATLDALTSARESGCNVLATHHPPIFKPVSILIGERHSVIFEAIRRDMALYCSHTNLDAAPDGVNACLAQKIGIKNPLPLEASTNGAWGMGAYGELEEASEIDDILKFIKNALLLSWIIGYGKRPQKPKKIKKIALCGGAGSDYLMSAVKCGADLFITADMNYHLREEAAQLGVYTANLDHAEMERAAMENYRAGLEEAGGIKTILIDETKIKKSFIYM